MFYLVNWERTIATHPRIYKVCESASHSLITLLSSSHCIEYRDACKVKAWKYSFSGKNMHICSDEVRDYLDQNMPGWRDRVYSHHGQSSALQLEKARQIVERYEERGRVLPRR